jgi:hypothetical protein
MVRHASKNHYPYGITPEIFYRKEIMSKPVSKKHGESHADQSGQHESNHKGLTLIVLFCFLGIMPVLIWVSLPETSTYTSVTTSSVLVQTAAAAAGLQICSQNSMTVAVPGAQSAILYQLSPDCSATSPSTTVQILVVGFTSTDAQKAAIEEAQVTYQNWQTTNTAAFMDGYNVIVVQGAPGNQAVQQISTSFIDQGAVRII